jgi:hypothetical protein
LASQLLESIQQDELYHYEKYQQLNQQEVEHQHSLYNTPVSTMYICPLCKTSYVHLLQNTTRVCCERRGCPIDLDIRVPELRVDFVMDSIMKMLVDHRQQCEEDTRGKCCMDERAIKVKVAALSEVGMCDPPVYDDQG